MSRLIVGPFNRVEGDLEVKLEISGGAVQEARVVSTLYRGFERILSGKPPMDALVYAPRICGICSVSQSVAAANALARYQGLRAPPNGGLATSIVHAVENITDHLTHFYLFFMPDFARDIYQERAWFGTARERFKAVSGSASADVLPARAAFLHVLGILAGKWPHTLSVQPGGSTRSVTINEIVRVQSIVSAFRRFLERTLFGDTLDCVSAIRSFDELISWGSKARPSRSDFGCFLLFAQDLELHKLGRATDNFMSYGAYGHAGDALFASGIYASGQTRSLDIGAVTEDHSHAWYTQTGSPLPPSLGTTEPMIGRDAAYSWCKAPRLGGNVMEVGAIARQAVNGHPLIRDLVVRDGGNVLSRVVARVLEIALVVQALQTWISELEPSAPFCEHAPLPADGTGVGLTEAARGSLGHWLTVKGGRIASYQIVAPTTWNFSPRDAAGTPGPLEQALVGAPVRNGESEPVAVQHIVRSFDPCLVCTVH